MSELLHLHLLSSGSSQQQSFSNLVFLLLEVFGLVILAMASLALLGKDDARSPSRSKLGESGAFNVSFSRSLLAMYCTYLRSGFDDVIGRVEIVFGKVVGALVVLVLETWISPVVE